MNSDSVAFSVHSLIIVDAVHIHTSANCVTDNQQSLALCTVCWEGRSSSHIPCEASRSRYFLHLIGQIFQQVLGNVSSQLHSKGESAEDKSRNEGMYVYQL